MTLNGAIKQLHDLRCADDIPAYYKPVIDEIINVLLTDVCEIRHGQWVPARGSWCTPGGDPVRECSECGKGLHVYGIEHGSYGADVADGQWVSCPNCGAMISDKTKKLEECIENDS